MHSVNEMQIFKICRYLLYIFPTCKIDKRGSCHTYYYYFTHTLPNILNSYTGTNTITPTDQNIPFMKFADCRHVTILVTDYLSWSQIKLTIGYSNLKPRSMRRRPVYMVIWLPGSSRTQLIIMDLSVTCDHGLSFQSKVCLKLFVRLSDTKCQ
jgi:hypothetical protein